MISFLWNRMLTFPQGSPPKNLLKVLASLRRQWLVFSLGTESLKSLLQCWQPCMMLWSIKSSYRKRRENLINLSIVQRK
jgi:hypothetical protein